ncbi:MAG: acyl-CoA dehydrogenase family protein [Proteobacteria bacterium]|nr:acyl-CoA dehydrogenase family protein [Pseudomonadota bacterium]
MTEHETTRDLARFRAEVRDFLRQAVPPDIARAVRAHCLVTREHAERWQRVLHARGWGAPGWPQAHGGPGWSLVEQAVFREELAASDAPRYENLGIETIAPTLMRFGTPEQCARFLPRMLSFDDFWAQGYSEPDAGSDLAALRTTARREGDHYLVDGSKIWQSFGHWANWALVLARTDPAAPRKQQGISVLMIDLRSPGVSVRPIRYMNGAQFHVQIFFDEVRVPAAHLVGAEHEGWSIAKGLLVTERLFVSRVAECKAELAATAQLAQGRGPGGTSLLAQDVYARRHAELAIRVRALQADWWPAVSAAQAGADAAPDLSLRASLLKLQGNEVLQDLLALQLDLVGTDALGFDPQAIDGEPAAEPLTAGHAHNLPLHAWRYRGITLAGGASEIQRGLIAKELFGSDAPLRPQAGANAESPLLDDALRRLLAQRYGFEQRRQRLARPGGFDGGFWQALREMGLFGLGVPEADGGYGGSLADWLPLMEALGEALVLEPVPWSVLLPSQLLAAASGWSGRREALKQLQAGTPMALAHAEAPYASATPLRTRARRDAAGWRVDGAKRGVMGGDVAQRLLLSAVQDDGRIVLLDCPVTAPGVQPRAYRLHDGRGAADFSFDAVRLPADALVLGADDATPPIDNAIDHAIDFATVALCAESVGAMRRALALTLEHLRTRRQFGRALADFQVLQHRAVELFRLWTQARSLVREAAAEWDSTPAEERRRRVSAAKWMCGRAGQAIALDTLQLHGAIGLQDETPISHYAKRLSANDTLLGDATHQLGRFIAAQRTAS